MKHVKDIQILDMLSGHIEDADSDSMLDISQCQECRQRFNDLKATWDELGKCEIDTSGFDLVGALPSPNGIHRQHMAFWSVQGLTRIAASVLLAVSIGYLSAKFSVQKTSDEWALATAQAAYLEVLSPASSTGWGGTGFPEDTSESERTP